jgi:hypothetical protein
MRIGNVRGEMKSLILAACLAAIATSAAAATLDAEALDNQALGEQGKAGTPRPPKVVSRLPNAMLGSWCFSKGNYYANPNPDWGSMAIVSDKPNDRFDLGDCANHGGVRFFQRNGKTHYQLGRFEWRANCEISKIEMIGSAVYRVSSYCRAKRGVFGPDTPLEEAKRFEIRQIETKTCSKGDCWQELRWRDLLRPDRKDEPMETEQSK